MNLCNPQYYLFKCPCFYIKYIDVFLNISIFVLKLLRKKRWRKSRNAVLGLSSHIISRLQKRIYHQHRYQIKMKMSDLLKLIFQVNKVQLVQINLSSKSFPNMLMQKMSEIFKPFKFRIRI